jgi:hypothetical protein
MLKSVGEIEKSIISSVSSLVSSFLHEEQDIVKVHRNIWHLLSPNIFPSGELTYSYDVMVDRASSVQLFSHLIYNKLIKSYILCTLQNTYRINFCNMYQTGFVKILGKWPYMESRFWKSLGLPLPLSVAWFCPTLVHQWFELIRWDVTFWIISSYCGIKDNAIVFQKRMCHTCNIYMQYLQYIHANIFYSCDHNLFRTNAT